MAVIKSTNGGISWPNISIPVIGGKGTLCEAIAVAPSDSAIVYAGGQKDRDPVIYRSADAGITWEDIASNLLLQRYNEVLAIWVSPYDPDTVVVGTSSGVFRWAIEDRSQIRTWEMTTINQPTHDFTYDPATETIYAATYLGVFISDDAGASWYEVNDGLGHLPSLCIDIDSQNRLLYVGTDGGGVWRIALQAFADQGIDLANVDKIAIGLGSKGGAAAGGTGTMYIDDIRLYQP